MNTGASSQSKPNPIFKAEYEALWTVVEADSFEKAREKACKHFGITNAIKKKALFLSLFSKPNYLEIH